MQPPFLPPPCTVQVPGTTANLGPGFDTLGLALRLYNKVTVTPSPIPGVRITSPIAEDARPGATEMLSSAASAIFDRIGQARFGFEISLLGDVPIARGLGSSVTARLGCIAALNGSLGEPLDRQSLLELVTELEGHPDNAAPAIFGGFTTAGLVGRKVRCFRFPVAEELKFVTLIPNFEVSTPAARKLVPGQFSKADTVHSLNRTSLITAAFAQADYESLRGCFDDVIHQPYRQQLIPQLSDVIAAGEEAGAIAGWLSGSGSTIICMTLKEEHRVASSMQRALTNSQVHVLRADPNGFTYLRA
jgi:homoserine kinase